MAVGVLLADAAVAAAQLTFTTPNGTLTVEVDAAADVRFKNGKLEIYDAAGTRRYLLEASDRNQVLPPGEYLVKVTGADGVVLDTDRFLMQRNGTALVRVTATGPPKAPALVPGSGLRFDGAGVVEIPTLSRHDHTPITIEAVVTLAAP